MASNGVPGPAIPQFYAGRTIFITGASGFLGQVLVERLLTTCPELKRLYLLLRQKRDLGAEDRLRKIKESPVFVNIRERCPSQLDKLEAVPGDISEPKLGLDDAVIEQLKDVTMVFHSAALLKFQEELSLSFDQNTRSVLRALDLCDLLPNLEAFVYVSTAYSNSEKITVEERVYETSTPLAAMAAIADHVSKPALAKITDEIIQPKPNTYTYTKTLAEISVRDHQAHYAKAIFRPTIVVSSLRHPFPGWIQNLNGPSGYIAGAGKGVLHVMHINADAKLDMLPVDIGIDTLIAVGWETVIDKPSETRVYNCSTQSNPVTTREFMARGRRNLVTCPFDNVTWYPSWVYFENEYVYKAVQFLLNTVPLFLMDCLCFLIGKKNRMSFMTINSRLQGMNEVLAFFSLRTFHFENGNVQKLRKRLTPEDAAIYNLDPGTIDWDDHHLNFIRGIRRYIFKEKDENIPKAQKHMKRMYVLHCAMLVLMFFLLFRSAIKITVALFT